MLEVFLIQAVSRNFRVAKGCGVNYCGRKGLIHLPRAGFCRPLHTNLRLSCGFSWEIERRNRGLMIEQIVTEPVVDGAGDPLKSGGARLTAALQTRMRATR
ncbi:MAG: hypothetical protein RXR20_00025 [Paraburkholderia sp.]